MSSIDQDLEKKCKKKLQKVEKAPPLKQETVEIIAKPPSKPEGPLEIVDGTILKWQQPSNDGGAPISHYIVEQECPVKSMRFRELKKQNCKPEPKIDLQDNLIEEVYENVLFRISAVNIKGQSDFHIETISFDKTDFIAKGSKLRFDAVEFVPSPCSINVSHVSLTCEPTIPLDMMNGSYENGDSLSYDTVITYEKEIDTILDECIQNLNYEPRQLERFIEDQSLLFSQWIECLNSCYYAAEKIINLSSQSSDEWHNFRYFGAKICSQIINLDKTSNFATNVLNICSAFVSMIQSDHTNPCIKGFMLFLAELYKLLEGQEQNAEVGQLLLKALHTLVTLPYDQQNSKITIVVTILKCCGFLLYPNHMQETEQLFIPLGEIKAQCNFKDAKMIESLENCRKSWKEEALSVSSNGLDSGEDGTSLSKPEEVFYGPDGSTTYVTLEESQFFEDSYRELDDGMSEDMDEAYERFLAEIPNRPYNGTG